jgi:hypothetical protein
MFKVATKLQYEYLVWIKFISRKYNEDIIDKGGSTFFFVNEDGWVVTCRHVLELMLEIEKLNDNYKQFSTALKLDPKRKYQLEKDFKLKKNNVCQGAYQIGTNLNPNSQFRWIAHQSLDIALIHFDVPSPTKYCTFVEDMSEIEQGSSLARIGFPFVEFNNFSYDKNNKILEFTPNVEPMVTFTVDGIVSQNGNAMIDGSSIRTLIVMSTPGIKGQSGGPLYDVSGRVAGMQSATSTRDLNFIGKTQIKNKEVEVPQFLNIGICVSAEAIKDFLTKQNVKFYTK